MGDPSNHRARTWEPPRPPALPEILRDPQARKRWIRYWITDVFFGIIKLTLYGVMRFLPIDRCSSLGSFLARHIARRYHAKADQRARKNFRHFHPDWSEAQIDSALDQMWDHLGRTMAEFATFDQLAKHGRITIQGAESLLKATQDGPVLFMALHVGNWEALGVATATLGLDTHSVYEPPNNRFEHWIARRARTGYGMHLLPPGKAATLPLVRILKNRGIAAIFGDDERKGKINAPFFGKPVNAHCNLAYIARIAAKTGAAIIPVWCKRENGCHFQVTFEAPIKLNPQPNKQSQLEDIQKLNDLIEPIILKHLAQWFWLPDYRLEQI